MNCPSCQFVLPDDKATECPFCHAPLNKPAGAAPTPAGEPFRASAADLLPPLPKLAPSAAPPAPAAAPPAAAPPLPGIPALSGPKTNPPQPAAPAASAMGPGRSLGGPKTAPPVPISPPASAAPAPAPRAFELPAATPLPPSAPLMPAPSLITPPPAKLPGPAPLEVGIPGIPFPGAPGLAPPPDLPGFMPPSMPTPGEDPPLAVPTPGETLPAAAPPPAQASLDPLDPLAYQAPAPQAAPPPNPREAARAKAAEIEWEPAPPPEKSASGNLLLFAGLAAVGVCWQGYRSGMISLDMIPGFSKPAPPPEPIAKPPTAPEGGGDAPTGPAPTPTAPEPPAPATLPQTPLPTPVAKPLVEEPEAPVRRERWVFEGKLYDMLTLRPVFGAQLKLEAEGEKPVTAETDERGRFRLEPPALEKGAYALSIAHQDYDGKRWFDDISPPYRTLEASERSMLRRVVPRHKPWAGRVGTKVRRDLVIFPASLRITETTPAPDAAETPAEGE